MKLFLWAVVLGAFVIVAPPPAQALTCELEAAPAALSQSADEWLAEAPESLRRSLSEGGIAFPGRGLGAESFLPLCDAVTPAVVIFRNSPARVFELLIQTERHGEFLGKADGSGPVSRAPLDHVDRHEIQILFTSITYHLRHRWDEEGKRIWWDLSPLHDNDLSGLVGYWELYPLRDGRALGFYGTGVDVGPVIPKRMQATITRRNVRSAVLAIRDWVDREAGGDE